MKKLVALIFLIAIASSSFAAVKTNPVDVGARLMGLHEGGGNLLAFNDNGSWAILPDPEKIKEAHHSAAKEGSGVFPLEVFRVDTTTPGEQTATEMFVFTSFYSDYENMMETLQSQIADGAGGFYLRLYNALPAMQQETGKTVQHVIYGFIDNVIDAEYWRKNVSTRWDNDAMYSEFNRDNGEVVILIASNDGMYTIVYLQ